MNKAAAKQICKLAAEIAENLHAAQFLSPDNTAQGDFRTIHRAVVHVVRELTAELVVPIAAQHPDALPQHIFWSSNPLIFTPGVRSTPQDRAYVPLDKFDIERAEKLLSLEQATLQRISPYLLAWIQDMNWPVAGRVSKALARVGEPIVPLIRHVLGTDDGIWKVNCIRYVVTCLPDELSRQLQPELARLAESPTESEKLEEVDQEAREVLEKLGNQT